MAVTGHPHRVRLPLHFSADQPDNEPGKRAPVRRVHHALFIKHKLLSRNDPVTNSTKGKVNRSRSSLVLRTRRCTKHPRPLFISWSHVCFAVTCHQRSTLISSRLVSAVRSGSKIPRWEGGLGCIDLPLHSPPPGV